MQLLVNVWDAENPTVVVGTSVTLIAIRNEYAPVFTQSDYRASVNDYDPVGKNITRVTATDQDLPVRDLHYALLTCTVAQSCRAGCLSHRSVFFNC